MAQVGKLNLRKIISPSALYPQAVKSNYCHSYTENNKLLFEDDHKYNN